MASMVCWMVVDEAGIAGSHATHVCVSQGEAQTVRDERQEADPDGRYVITAAVAEAALGMPRFTGYEERFRSDDDD